MSESELVRNYELLCLRLVRQLPRDNPVRLAATAFLAKYGSGTNGILREDYPAVDFGELKGSPADELPSPAGTGELKGSPLDELEREMFPHGRRRCPKCGGAMRHERLRGYRCGRCD